MSNSNPLLRVLDHSQASPSPNVINESKVNSLSLSLYEVLKGKNQHIIITESSIHPAEVLDVPQIISKEFP